MIAASEIDQIRTLDRESEIGDNEAFFGSRCKALAMENGENLLGVFVRLEPLRATASSVVSNYGEDVHI